VRMRRVSPATVRARAAVSMLIIFEAFAVPLFLLFVYVGFNRNAGWNGAMITAGCCLFILAWWRSFHLIIDNEVLIYKALFLSRKKIRLSDITHVVRKVDFISRGVRPPNRMEIYGRVDGRLVEFDINMKVFRFEDVQKIELALKPAIENPSNKE
jgi:hypothetical protein